MNARAHRGLGKSDPLAARRIAQAVLSSDVTGITRGGDRRLNQTLHTAVVTRIRMDPQTRAYIERRTAQGQTLREIRRRLKRYLTRQISRHLNAAGWAGD